MQNFRPYLVALLLAGCSEVPLPTPATPGPTPAVSPTPSPVPSPTPLTPDVQATTPGGVGYTILEPAPPGARVAKFGDTVAMDYTGWLVNGKQFDSSAGKQPYVFKIGAGGVIEGWDLGTPGMGVGEVRKLVIPPELGYGSAGMGPIPGDATLIFKVKLVSIQ